MHGSILEHRDTDTVSVMHAYNGWPRFYVLVYFLNGRFEVFAEEDEELPITSVSQHSLLCDLSAKLHQKELNANLSQERLIRNT